MFYGFYITLLERKNAGLLNKNKKFQIPMIKLEFGIFVLQFIFN
jgi:hypothetical protein